MAENMASFSPEADSGQLPGLGSTVESLTQFILSMAQVREVSVICTSLHQNTHSSQALCQVHIF